MNTVLMFITPISLLALLFQVRLRLYQYFGLHVHVVALGLKIISRESPDTMTSQIHYRLVTYMYPFWPVKFIR